MHHQILEDTVKKGDTDKTNEISNENVNKKANDNKITEADTFKITIMNKKLERPKGSKNRKIKTPKSGI